MAAVKPEAVKADPARQEQSRAPAAPRNQNLDMLQGMLNLVFLNSGRFIKEHQEGGGTGRMKLNLEKVVPVAAERFNDALDELENEVRMAQAVLRRDLAVMKQDRKKREAAARQHEVDKARLAAESRQNVPTKRLDAPVKKEPTTPAHVEDPAADSQPNKPAKPAEPAASLKREAEHVSPPPPASATSAPTTGPALGASLAANNPPESEFDFDAIFGDEMDTSGGADNSQEDTKMDTTADPDVNLDEGPSLLRGLEDFAKSSDEDTSGPNTTNMDVDFAMPDLPDLHTNTNTPPVPPPTTTKPVENPVAQPVVSSDVNADLLVADNLEDLFNMDDYENPENSSFDDAFFNFDHS